MTNKLPPLPISAYGELMIATDEDGDAILDDCYTEAQMQAYGQACRDAAIEEAALAVEAGVLGHGECGQIVRGLK
jgi:hypothetical protein